MAPLRIAILKADTPIPPVDDKYGGYGGMYKTWLRAAQKKSRNDAELEFTDWDVVDDQAYPKLEDVDVVVITGSSMSVGPFIEPQAVEEVVRSAISMKMQSDAKGCKFGRIQRF